MVALQQTDLGRTLEGATGGIWLEWPEMYLWMHPKVSSHIYTKKHV